MDVTITPVDKCAVSQYRWARINLQVSFRNAHRGRQHTNFAETACRTTPLSNLVSELLASASSHTHTQKTNSKLFGECFCQCRTRHYWRKFAGDEPQTHSRSTPYPPSTSKMNGWNIHTTQYDGKVSWYQTISTHCEHRRNYIVRVLVQFVPFSSTECYCHNHPNHPVTRICRSQIVINLIFHWMVC